MLAYLAGAIEYSPDLGRGWRREITPFLRLIQSDEVVIVGAAEIYEARCRRCFEPLHPPAKP